MTTKRLGLGSAKLEVLPKHNNIKEWGKKHIKKNKTVPTIILYGKFDRVI
jgi:hypothetical protein